MSYGMYHAPVRTEVSGLVGGGGGGGGGGMVMFA